VLRDRVGDDGLRALREKAVIVDFDPNMQVWRWHATVVEYIAARQPMDEGEAKRQRLRSRGRKSA